MSTSNKHVAVGRGHVRLGVVLHVVGAQAKILVLDFDFAVGEVEVAFLALLFGFQTHAGLARGGWRNDFLRGGSAKRKQTDGQRQEDASPACGTEFMEEVHELAPPHHDRTRR